MDLNPQVEQAVMKALNNIARGYAQKDTSMVLDNYKNDPGVIGIGTGIDEWRVGWDEIKKGIERNMEQADNISIRFTQHSVKSHGTVAWFVASCDINLVVDSAERSLVGRFTGILEKGGEGWKIVQSHLSLPDSRQEEGKSYPSC